MKYFEKYTSNTIAGSGNQHFFVTEKDKIHRGRIYYKIFAFCCDFKALEEVADK